MKRICTTFCVGFSIGMAGIAFGAQEQGAAARLPVPADIEKLLAARADDTTQQKNDRQQREEILENSVKPEDKAAAELALANWLLAKPTARPATRWFLGMDREEDLRAMADSAATAQDHLTAAEKILKDHGSGDSPAIGKSDLRRLSARLGTLKSFAAVMTALGKSGADKLDGEAWSALALGLSESRESETGPLASAAALWQAAAWVQAGRRERALTMLPDALTKPDHPFDYVGRLLRCRLLAESGQYGAAMALTSRVGASVATWYPKDKPNAMAARRRLAGLLQLAIGQQWAAKLKTGTQPADAELLGDVMGKLKKDLFGGSGNENDVYTLDLSLPLIIEPPAVESKKTPADDEKPAKPADSAPADVKEGPADPPTHEPDSDSKPE